jgi:hypothetical protein
MTNHILKNEGKTLSGLLKKVDQLREFNSIFAQYVEPHIATHCKIANLQNNCLIVIVDSGNWATQLRFHIPDILSKMRQHPSLQGVKAICCKTRPDPTKEKVKIKRVKREIKQISQKTAKHMMQSASSIQDDKVRESLERIAKRLEEK